MKDPISVETLRLPEQRRRVVNPSALGTTALELSGRESPTNKFNVLDLVVDAAQVNSDTSPEEFMRIFGIPMDPEILERFPLLTTSFEEKRGQYLSGHALMLLENIYTDRKNELRYMSQAKAEIIINHLIAEYAERNTNFARDKDGGKIHSQRVLLMTRGMSNIDIARATNRTDGSVSTVYKRFIDKMRDMPSDAKNAILDDLRSYGTKLNVNQHVPAMGDQSYRDDVSQEWNKLLPRPAVMSDPYHEVYGHVDDSSSTEPHSVGPLTQKYIPAVMDEDYNKLVDDTWDELLTQKEGKDLITKKPWSYRDMYGSAADLREWDASRKVEDGALATSDEGYRGPVDEIEPRA